MSEAVKSIDHKGLKIEIRFDSFVDNPREHDSQAVFICFHRRYILGDKHDFDSPQHFQEWFEENKDDIAAIKPLYLYDHSGITMNTTGFSCPWDSGQVGYAYVSKKAAEGIELTPEEIIENEVETYDCYLRNDVYYYTISQPSNVPNEEDDLIDTCGGFYGLNHCVEDATAAADHHAEVIAKKSASQSN